VTPLAVQKELADIGEKRSQKQKIDQEIQNLKNVGVDVPANFKPDPNVMHIGARDLQTDLQSKGIKVPTNFATLYGIAHYKGTLSDLPSNPRKGQPTFSRQRRHIHPHIHQSNYDRNNYDA